MRISPFRSARSPPESWPGSSRISSAWGPLAPAGPWCWPSPELQSNDSPEHSQGEVLQLHGLGSEHGPPRRQASHGPGAREKGKDGGNP